MYRVYCISFLTLAFMNISSGFRLVNKHWPPQYLKYASNGSLPWQESCAQCSTHICEILMIKPRSDAWTCTRIQWYYYWSKNIFQTVTAFFWKGQFLLFIVRRKSRFLILTLKKALWHWTQSKNIEFNLISTSAHLYTLRYGRLLLLAKAFRALGDQLKPLSIVLWPILRVLHNRILRL